MPFAAWVALSAPSERAASARPASHGAVHRPRRGARALDAVARASLRAVAELVTLFGAAGVGKSRLLAELLDRLAGARVLQGRCLPYGEGITYWPLAEAAKADAGILDTDPVDAALDKLRSAIASVGRGPPTRRGRGDRLDDRPRRSRLGIVTAEPVYARGRRGCGQRYLGALGRGS